MSDPLFTAEDLAEMASLSEDYLPDTCDIEQQVTTQTSGGGHTLAYQSIATDVPCRIGSIAGLRSSLSVTEVPATLAAQGLYVVIFARALMVGSPARPVRRTDRLIPTSVSDLAVRPLVASRPLNVEWIDDFTTARMLLRAFARDKAFGAGGPRP